MRTCTKCGETKTIDAFRPPPHQTQCTQCYNTYMREWRAKRAERDDAPKCSVSGCPRVLFARAMCKMHYNRLRRVGSVGPSTALIGAGDDVRYQAVHRRLMKERGPASTYICACGNTAAHWAFIEPDDVTKVQVDGELRYSTDLSTYVPMCHSCHRRHDQGSVGERNSQAVLAEDDVRSIRERYAAGGVSQSLLAAEYGITQSNVSHIVRRITWEHIA